MLVASCQWCAASCNMPMQPPPTTWALGANLAQQTFPVRLRIALKRLYLCHCQTSHSHLKKYSFNFGGSCLHCGNLKRSPWFDVELSLIKCNWNTDMFGFTLRHVVHRNYILNRDKYYANFFGVEFASWIRTLGDRVLIMPIAEGIALSGSCIGNGN